MGAQGCAMIAGRLRCCQRRDAIPGLRCGRGDRYGCGAMRMLAWLPGEDAAREGAGDAVGVAAAVMFAGFLGFGALAADTGLSVGAALFSTVAIWALPGQLVLAEMSAAGATWVAILPAVMLVNARFLPMTVSLMPLLRAAGTRRVHLYLTAQLVAMTGWAVAMRRCPELKPEDRLPYYLGFAIACWFASLVGTGAGYYFAHAFPPLLKLGLVFLSPLYFFVMLACEVRQRAWLLAMAAGALLAPGFHLVSPEWSILTSGLAGGTLAFLVIRASGAGDA